VNGTSIATVGEESSSVRPNELTCIKMGEVHKLENLSKIDLVLIEAHVGNKLVEMICAKT